MRKEAYLALYTGVYSRPRLAKALAVISTVITYITVAVYGFFLGYLIFGDDTVRGLQLLAVTATPFVIVTLMRRIINAPRPYEVLECEALAPLSEVGRKGSSFPSRHMASSFIVGSSLCFIYLPAGIAVMSLGILLGFCRVALGRHFLRDVIVGGVIGGIAGTVGMLITMI
ncbi:MAG: phosphatase PAP2 family protein [Clostridia bacterium]|nr:phosphatase PAP2 family protein [Clostridia bacterium]